jgi:hypothetical protein
MVPTPLFKKARNRSFFSESIFLHLTSMARPSVAPTSVSGSMVALLQPALSKLEAAAARSDDPQLKEAIKQLFAVTKTLASATSIGPSAHQGASMQNYSSYDRQFIETVLYKKVSFTAARATLLPFVWLTERFLFMNKGHCLRGGCPSQSTLLLPVRCKQVHSLSLL